MISGEGIFIESVDCGKKIIRYALTIKGIVQGVGFRPYLYRLAKSLSLGGYVRNTADGVYAEIEGESTACQRFIDALKHHPPVRARIQSIHVEERPREGEADFHIVASSRGRRNALVSPDMGICAACAAEIADKSNRRYRYAFTNCTDCGPRFTIIRETPYDRKNTTMAAFVMCPACRQEYEDPLDRRFHAQPNACPACGPELYFYKAGERQEGDPLLLFDECIREGGIVAVKGLGGYHLACDACNPEAVSRLRRRKLRYEKPFALMMRDLNTAKRFCWVDSQEEAALLDARKPIVLLRRKEEGRIAEEVAPGNQRLGVMLPYTPLHCLIMENNQVLVMTSANISDRPMIYDDAEAAGSLFAIAEAMLTHNREIFRRVDDSVCLVAAGQTRMIRRARGYAPEPLRLEGNRSVILALGAQQKNTFCLAKGEDAFLSGHIGDLDDPDTERFYEREIESYLRLFSARPEVVACDLHPDYVSSRYARRFKKELPVYQIQHHHAHFASVLAEHNLKEKAVGLIFDGTGYGEDGTLWGGEALWGDIAGTERIGHLLPAPLLGGEAAIREPWRMALAMVYLACGKEEALEYFAQQGDKAALLLQAGERGINAPATTGAGRLFDAVAALAGVRTHTTYEGQAAIDLEQVLDDSAAGSYGFDIAWEGDMMIFDWRQLIRDVVRDARKGLRCGEIAAKFHRAVVQLLADVSLLARKHYGSGRVVLSGGVFQNAYLLDHGVARLKNSGFEVYTNAKVPANDGGISFGQAAAASRRLAS
ncbi:MAG: carbamoyltransferase HypF [Dethiobacteria bacterium]|mgnify:FL=1|nr:carbamoyltransferase HypF [Bacillota bacterium]HOP68650.1 carbamoyltransferase HypF [Bacillota bacterium]HPT33994.1 carbamoyltransferase HypF [Bacillota bacterium]HQD06894.1 carbamoyltransferase HypF [Bacillota bacterium]